MPEDWKIIWKDPSKEFPQPLNSAGVVLLTNNFKLVNNNSGQQTDFTPHPWVGGESIPVKTILIHRLQIPSVVVDMLILTFTEADHNDDKITEHTPPPVPAFKTQSVVVNLPSPSLQDNDTINVDISQIRDFNRFKFKPYGGCDNAPHSIEKIDNSKIICFRESTKYCTGGATGTLWPPDTIAWNLEPYYTYSCIILLLIILLILLLIMSKGKGRNKYPNPRVYPSDLDHAT